MSRVISSTFRCAAVGGVLALALGLAACGGDGSSASDSSPVSGANVAAADGAPTSAAVATTTPPTASAATGESTKQGGDSQAASTAEKAVVHPDVAVTKEGSRAIAKADSTRIEPAAFGQQVEQVAASLRRANFDVTIARGVADSPTVIQADYDINVLVFRSDKLAARQAANYVSILSVTKNAGRVARRHNVVVALLPVEAKATVPAKTLKRFNHARRAAT